MEPTRRQYALASLTGGGLALLALVIIRVAYGNQTEEQAMDIVFDMIGALVPILIIGAMIAVVRLFDAIRAELGHRRIVRTIGEAARTCDWCGKIARHALLPTSEVPQKWLCFDCHGEWLEARDYFETVEWAIEHGWDPDDR